MKASKGISAFSLILLALISASSFKIGLHFCGGKVQSMAFLSNAAPCPLEKNLPPCHKHQMPTCCDDQSIIHEGDDVQNSDKTDFAFSAPIIDAAPYFVIVDEIIPPSTVHFAGDVPYQPPFRAVDLTVQHRVFLI